jgi:hypothetical protein
MSKASQLTQQIPMAVLPTAGAVIAPAASRNSNTKSSLTVNLL